ncbi:MAG: tetratricopeptide repeat protein [Thermodesulfobacteriota bacterium]|nr:tetratricopeptide repeat protein [Thermodesulfobacteriota bacterium]
MERVRFISFWIPVSLVLMLAFAVPYAFAIEKKVEEALLKGNWEKVIEILKQDDSKANDPVARLIMGHACLATNKNNESMLLFLSLKEDSDLKLWVDWTQSFLGKYSQNPIPLFLSADARARQGRFKEAIDEFTKAISVKEDFALAYNGRGVARVLNNEWDGALVDFIRAMQVDSKLSDAYASLGNYWVIREAPDGAIEAFNQALSINSEFALAYNGRGAGYFGKGEFDNAAMDFSIASQLSPILLIADINQGFVSAYGSKLITVAEELKKKPGMTFKSINEQYPNLLKEQHHQLLNMLPSQRDQEFWRKIDKLPELSQNELKFLIQEHGLQKVQIAVFLKIQDFSKEATEINQKQQHLASLIPRYNTKILGLQLGETILSLGLASRGTIRDIGEGPEYSEMAQAKAEFRTTGAFASYIPNRGWSLFFSAIPLNFEPITIVGKIIGIGMKLGRYHLEDERQRTLFEMDKLNKQAYISAANAKVYSDILRIFPDLSTQKQIKLPSSQIPGYYTSFDRPLTELGALASMVDKGIKVKEGLPRSALIVSQDPFRTNLLQSELSKYGFQTKVIPPGSDPQTIAKQWDADIILGIKGTYGTPKIDLKLPQLPRYRTDDFGPPGDFPPPMRPPAAIGTPQMIQPQIQQPLDWGKPFIPIYPKGSPGGISTEELAKSFVDKGNWPVLTSFSLLYMARPSAVDPNKGGGK